MDGGHQARVCLAQLLALPEVPVAQMLEGVDYTHRSEYSQARY